MQERKQKCCVESEMKVIGNCDAFGLVMEKVKTMPESKLKMWHTRGGTVHQGQASVRGVSERSSINGANK